MSGYFRNIFESVMITCYSRIAMPMQVFVLYGIMKKTWMNVLIMTNEWMSYDQWPLLNDPRLTMSNDPGSIRICEDYAHSMQSWKYQWPIYAVIGTNDHSMQSWLPMTIQFGLGFHSSSLQKFHFYKLTILFAWLLLKPFPRYFAKHLLALVG